MNNQSGWTLSAQRGVGHRKERRQILDVLSEKMWMSAGVVSMATGIPAKHTFRRLLELVDRKKAVVRYQRGHGRHVPRHRMMFRRV